ncbi:MAG: TetR/AcrR family transcriptional regulator [Saprospiraceae bacterium]
MPVTKIDKNELLRICWQVFNKNGYHATSISMLAEATGLGKSGLLHHYPSKVELMAAVLEFSKSALEEYVLSVSSEALPPEQRLEKLLRRQNRLAKMDRRGCFFANTALETGRDEKFRGIVSDAFQSWENAVAGLLSFSMNSELAKEKAHQMLLEYEGSVMFYKFTGDEQHLERYVEKTIREFKLLTQ